MHEIPQEIHFDQTKLNDYIAGTCKKLTLKPVVIEIPTIKLDLKPTYLPTTLCPDIEGIIEGIRSGISSYRMDGENTEHSFGLPCELWIIILSQLSAHNLVIVSQVSRCWYNLTRDPRLLSMLRSAKQSSHLTHNLKITIDYSRVAQLSQEFFERQRSLDPFRSLGRKWDLIAPMQNIWTERQNHFHQEEHKYRAENPGTEGKNNGFCMY